MNKNRKVNALSFMQRVLVMDLLRTRYLDINEDTRVYSYKDGHTDESVAREIESNNSFSVTVNNIAGLRNEVWQDYTFQYSRSPIPAPDAAIAELQKTIKELRTELDELKNTYNQQWLSIIAQIRAVQSIAGKVMYRVKHVYEQLGLKWKEEDGPSQQD